MERVHYAQTVQDEAEERAVLGVLRGGPGSLRPGPNVAEVERRVAALQGRSLGLMVNSGSSALLLAVELLGLPPGSEVITSPLTFGTDITALVKAGLVPVFCDVRPDTYNVDEDGIEALISPRTAALFFPNLVGNAPDWDVVRAIADAHGLLVVEDTCDALGATLRGTPTSTRADISATSFAMAHVITCGGTGGMVLLDDDALRDRGLMLRRWGRRSEPHLYGSHAATTGKVFREDLDGVAYDNDWIFDEIAYNMEPSELGAAFGVAQLAKLEAFVQRRQRNFERYSAFFEARADVFARPRQLEGLETAWLCYPFRILPGAGFGRPELQEHLEAAGIDTRTVWTGNVTRHPMMAGVDHRVPPGGLPNADEVMARSMLVPNHHALTDELVDHVCGAIDAFLAR